MHTYNFLESGLPPEAAAQSELSATPTLPQTDGDPLRHILLGSPGGVRQTIHLLHTLRYVETALWSPLVAIPNEQLIITPRQGEVMSILIRDLR
ncbi:MAG: hypothetical protein AAF152_14835 [Cyanobacteria bacterium P01_A01_bin.114]